MNRFNDNLVLFVCVFSLFFAGYISSLIFGSTSIIEIASFVSSIATIAGFYLAFRAYFHWKKQDSIKLQVGFIHEILIELSVLRYKLSHLFSDCILREGNNQSAQLHASDDELEKISNTLDTIYLLMSKYDAIEVKDSNVAHHITRGHPSRPRMVDDKFYSLGALNNEVHRLIYYIKDGKKLTSNGGRIYSEVDSKFPAELLLSNANSFSELSLKSSENIHIVESQLRGLIR